MQVNRYDAEGLRHELEENGRLVQFIFNDSREVVAEQDENKWMLYIRASSLLASSTDHARTYYHYASDEMGSTTHIVDGEGAVQNRYVYDAWGNVTEQTETIPNRYKFNGQQLDPITQQYYLRARFYNPVIARFTQEDTYRGDGLNLYAYCANNPMVYEDPTGFAATACLKNAFDTYRQQGMSVPDAYAAAKRDAEAAHASGVPIPKPDKPSNAGFQEHVRREQAFRDSLTSDVAWNNGWRTPDGKFASPQGDGLPGALAEQQVWNAIQQKDGWSVRPGRIYTTDSTGQVRVYDGVATSPSGHTIGLEIKSGTSPKTPPQRTFDNRVNAGSPATGIGQSSGLTIERVIEIRR